MASEKGLRSKPEEVQKLIREKEELEDNLETANRERQSLREQLEEEKLLTVYLKTLNNEKEKEIKHLREAFVQSNESSFQEIQLIHQENSARNSETQHRVRLLELDVQRLSEEVRVYKGYEHDLNLLREDHQKLVDEKLKLERRLEEMETEAKATALRRQQFLDKEFRLRLEEAIDEARQDVWEKMTEQSREAVVNARMMQEKVEQLQRQMNDVLMKYTSLKETHDKLKMELDIERNISLEEVRKTTLLKQKVAEVEVRNAAELSTFANRNQTHNQALAIELDKTRSALEKLICEYNAREHEIVRWKRKSNELQRTTELQRTRIQQLEGPIKLDDDKADGATLQSSVAAAGDQSAAGAASDDIENVMGIWNTNFSPAAVEKWRQDLRSRASSAPPASVSDAYRRFQSIDRPWGRPPSGPNQSQNGAMTPDTTTSGPKPKRLASPRPSSSRPLPKGGASLTPVSRTGSPGPPKLQYSSSSPGQFGSSKVASNLTVSLNGQKHSRFFVP